MAAPIEMDLSEYTALTRAEVMGPDLRSKLFDVGDGGQEELRDLFVHMIRLHLYAIEATRELEEKERELETADRTLNGYHVGNMRGKERLSIGERIVLLARRHDR